MNRFSLLVVSIFSIAFSAAVSIPSSPFLINGMTQKAISDMFPTAITPAAFTFSILSVIYISWLILAFLVIFKKVSLTNRQNAMLSLSIVISTLWLIPWGMLRIEIAMIVMLILLGTLWYTFSLVRHEHNVTRMTTELFMGWIHIAMFANLAILIKYFELDIDMGITYDVILLTLAYGATVFFQYRFRTFIVSAVFLWASLGIFMNSNIGNIKILVVVYALMIAGYMAYQKFFQKKLAK